MEKPTQKRKEREKEARREEILNAAAQLFSQKGFAAVTIDEIAALAELGKGTLYNYYKDKQDLFLSLMNRGHKNLFGTARAALQEPLPLPDLLLNLMHLSLNNIASHAYLFGFHIDAISWLSEDEYNKLTGGWRQEIQSWVEDFADMLERHGEASGLSRVEKETVGELVIASVRYIFLRYMLYEPTEIPREEVNRHIGIFCRLIGMESNK